MKTNEQIVRKIKKDIKEYNLLLPELKKDKDCICGAITENIIIEFQTLLNWIERK